MTVLALWESFHVGECVCEWLSKQRLLKAQDDFTSQTKRIFTFCEGKKVVYVWGLSVLSKHNRHVCKS